MHKFVSFYGIYTWLIAFITSNNEYRSDWIDSYHPRVEKIDIKEKIDNFITDLQDISVSDECDNMSE